MAFRSGGGQQHQEMGGHGGGRPSLGQSTSRPPTPAAPVYHNPTAAAPHKGVRKRGFEPSPTPSPSAIRETSSMATIDIQATSSPTAIRAPSRARTTSSRATTRAPSQALIRAARSPTSEPSTATARAPSPTTPPFKPDRVSGPSLAGPAPPTPTRSSTIGMEFVQKLFVTETALVPSAAAGQSSAEKAPNDDLGLARPARPRAGTIGMEVVIRGKHFFLDVAMILHYDVSINPQSKSRAANWEVLSELIKVHRKASVGGKLPAYDGRKSLYTAGSLPFGSGEFSVTLVLPEKNDKRAEREYKITIQIAGRIDLYHLQQLPSAVQYFMQRYNYNVQYTTWPCLQPGSDSRPLYLPMAACKIVEGQRYSKKLNDTQVTNILRATCQRPQQREQSICETVLHNKYAEDRFAQELGIKVCTDLVSVPDHVLPPLMLRYHDSRKEKTCVPNVGQWNMINKKMINGGTIDNCSKLPAYDGRESLCTTDSLPFESEEFSGTPIDPEMKDKERVETELKMTTQKIINGGAIDNLENGAPFVSEVPTVIVGASDVTTSPHRDDSASSTAPVVASMDKPEIAKYGGLASAQPYMQEVLEDLFNCSKDSQRVTANGVNMNELLITFRRKTGRRPQRIVFRDGVSEDQFCEVLFHETDRIRKAHASFEDEHILPVNFVVDQKKHHTRLFPKVHVRHGSLNSVSSTNGAIISQAGPLETHHQPNLDSVIQFFIDINGRRVSVQRTPEEDLGSAIAEAMLKTNCYIPDFYVGYEQHVLDLDQSILSQKIGQNSTVQVRPRVRGGVETIDMTGIRFEDRIQSFSHDDLFEERTVSPELMGTGRIRRGRTGAGREHVMRTLGRCTMHKLFEMLHLLHLRGISLNGNFTHENIIYLPLLDSYVIHENHVEYNHADYTPLGYEQDMRALGEVLKQLFTWKFPRSRARVFPVHVHHLLQTLNAMPFGASTSDAFKAYLRNHVSMLSPGAVEGLILEVHRYIRYQAENLQESTTRRLGSHVMHPLNLPYWTDVAKSVNCFKKVYNFQSYTNNKVSWFDFLRNFLTHPNNTKPPTFTIEEVDLAFAYHFDEALPSFLCDLVMGHTFISSHTVESVFSKDWFNTKVFVVDVEIASTSRI